jgi:plasmid rolling circle replication initiator protein Rep
VNKNNIIQTAGAVKLPERHRREIGELARKKKGAETAARTYKKTNLPDRDRKAFRLRLCGKKLVYAEERDGNPVLVSAMRCGLRLCPSCSWIRARKVFENVYRIIADPAFAGKRFVFLTLTVRNCSGGNLEGEISRLLSAWQTVTVNGRGPFRRSFAGTFRALEVTYNRDKNTYHPHLHALAAVDSGYFRKSNRDYVSHKKLRELWRNACGLSYLPQCRIERVRNSAKKQTAEVAKYTVKSADYLNRPAVLETLDAALSRKRLVAYGGLFREVKKRLELPDGDAAENGLPRPTLEELLRNPCVRKIIYEWKLGAYRVSVIEPTRPHVV